MTAIAKQLDLSLKDLSILLITISIILILSNLATSRRRRTTPLRGPSSKNYLFGLSKELLDAPDLGSVYESWEKEYGSVFAVPSTLGSKTLTLCDPKAISHFYSRDTSVYQQQGVSRFFVEMYLGRNLIWAEGDTHKRQRKALSSAFSNAAIRKVTSVFYDSAYALKARWDASLQDPFNDSVLFDVQQWMNYVSLDSIGAGGFSHDFESLKGNISSVATAFDSFGSVRPSLVTLLVVLLASIFPVLNRIPSQRGRAFQQVSESITTIARELIERARKERAASVAESHADKSIIGTLIRSESGSANVHMSLEEITAQVETSNPCRLRINIAYAPTTLDDVKLIMSHYAWALIELSRNPQAQTNLREELAQFIGEDPTYEELTSGLPYLDAIVCETLRLHPPLLETIRQAQEDDILPLSNPIYSAKGEHLESVFVAKGTSICVPIRCINRSEDFWGRNSKEFVPDRWLHGEAGQHKAAEIQGYRHLLTFIDGPRSCLGKGFALTEFKAVLSVLIRNFHFELPGGPATKIEIHRGILERPKVSGQEGPRVPLLVRRV